MQELREERLAGLAALEAVTSLLQRSRKAHPTAGLYEAAEPQWWWSTPRRTDTLAKEHGCESVALEVDQSDEIMHEVLASDGFSMK